MNVLSTKQQLDVLRMLVEGGSINGTSRYTGIARETCTRLMLRFGEGCKRFLNREMRDLTFEHLELDELWAFCGKKVRKITGDEPNLHEIGEFYLFWALSEQTRLIPSFMIGRRNEGTAVEFIFDLRSRIRIPKPHLSDAFDFHPEQYKPVLRISTDGFKAYENAIDFAFGPYAEYGQIVKKITKHDFKIEKRLIRGEIEPEQITTSLVERVNLTGRTFMRRLMRRSLSFSKKVSNLKAATAIFVAHYDYCWQVRTLKTTPAVAQGIIGQPWRLADLYANIRESWPELFYVEVKGENGKEVA